MSSEPQDKSKKEESKESKTEESNPFGGGSSISNMLQLGKQNPEKKQAQEEETEETADEEECSAQFQPIVQLDEVETQTGEESELVKFESKCKLYRFDNKANEWKERGTGQAKILEHKESKRIRMIMRQEKTLKLRANHIVVPTTLSEHQGSDKAFVWTTADYSDGELKYELLCIRFGTPEKAQNFKKEYELAMEHNKDLLNLTFDNQESSEQQEEKQDKKDANDLADQLEQSVKLNGKDDENKDQPKVEESATKDTKETLKTKDE